ncbi:hypothetical protein ACHAXH_001472 [Discostella pseudostelligera]
MLSWTEGKCINAIPVPSSCPTYTTQLACCKGAYGGQLSKSCIAALANPPTSSPVTPGGPDVYYPDYSLAWAEGKCINTVPVPSGHPTYTTQLTCCKGAYGGKISKCPLMPPLHPVHQLCQQTFQQLPIHRVLQPMNPPSQVCQVRPPTPPPQSPPPQSVHQICQ